MINNVTLIGRLTGDPKPIGENAIGATFSLANNRKYKDGKGEQKEETTFVNCEVFGGMKDIILQHLKKGRMIAVEGRLRSYKSNISVRVENFHFLDKNNDRSNESKNDNTQVTESQNTPVENRQEPEAVGVNMPF